MKSSASENKLDIKVAPGAPHPFASSRAKGWDGTTLATPEAVRQAQIGLVPRPPRLDHDALADSAVDKKTIYRFYSKGNWFLLDLPVE